MELFGYYFPPEIMNWFCDDWINKVYHKMQRLYPLRQHYCKNMGGRPRYHINNDPEFRANFKANMRELRAHCNEMVNRDFHRACEQVKGS